MKRHLKRDYFKSRHRDKGNIRMELRTQGPVTAESPACAPSRRAGLRSPRNMVTGSVRQPLVEQLLSERARHSERETRYPQISLLLIWTPLQVEGTKKPNSNMYLLETGKRALVFGLW